MTVSHQFITKSDVLVNNLSFSHIREIMVLELIRVSTVMGILYRIRISSADIVRKEKYSEEIC